MVARMNDVTINRTVLLTDLPAIYVYQTRLVPGFEKYAKLEPFDIGQENLIFADRSQKIYGRINAPSLGEVTFEDRHHVEAVADGLPVRQGQVTPLPISVICTFTPEGPAEVYAHVEVYGGRLVLRERGTVLVDLPLAHVTPHWIGRCLRIQANMRFAGRPASSFEIHLPTEALRQQLSHMIDEAGAGLATGPTSTRCRW